MIYLYTRGVDIWYPHYDDDDVDDWRRLYRETAERASQIVYIGTGIARGR